MKKIILTLPIVGVMLLAWSVLHGEQAGASAPCVNRAPNAQELQLLSAVQSWRSTNVPGTGLLTMSGPLNAAAMGYAQFLAGNGGQGHYADGSDWVGRAVQCGYPTSAAAGGEGVAADRAAVLGTAQLAVARMGAESGSGIWVPNFPPPYLPPNCAGVGEATGASGNIVWVVLLFDNPGSCPQAVAAGAPTAPSPSAPSPSVSPTSAFPTLTPTRTPIPLPTPLPTPIPTPTQHTWYIYAPFAGRD